jgi:hypothetical protein
MQNAKLKMQKAVWPEVRLKLSWMDLDRSTYSAPNNLLERISK